ncbi:MAG: PDDEXK nuclease domain-containing protein [Firmicutes bacterium]|nr:PDDEXK nuclease domain-containing protein [Bacillota bacterium]MCD7830681.1 PDDEXK nuclease domain-containing protein [Bacillota bacterium]
MNDIYDVQFYTRIKSILEKAQNQVYSAANSAMVQAYWKIGESIVKQQGTESRAEYGTQLIHELSLQLTRDFGKGFTEANLRNMRQFYMTFSNRYALRSELSWTHYRMLMRVEDKDAREFYMEECAKSNWSTRQLERQINSFFYQRLLSSHDKNAVREEILEKEPAAQPKDFIRDPYVLEFIGIKQSSDTYEKDLEQALIGELQKFLLELGRGFSFVARQKHIDLDGEHFYIDLVFYNYLLKCFVLIDLKTGKLTHQDIGQMDSYVRIFDEMQRGTDDNPTIGIILCSEKNEAIAKYSVLNEGKQLFASKYQFTLPTAEELQNYIEAERRKYDERSDIL